MADILALVGTVVGLLTAAEGAYDKIKEIRGLPQAFAEISLRLPLAREILDKVDKKYANLPLSKVGAIAPVIEDCRNNAESLKTILQKLQPKDSASSWSNIVNRYTSIIKSMGKKERVEDLIKKILQDTQQLANNEAIKAATSEELEKLENAIKHMNMVEKSVSDEALEDGKGVSITGTGPQNFQVGDNNKLYTHSGSGHVIENATFGASSESRKGKVLRALYCASYEDHKDRNPEAAPDTCFETALDICRPWLRKVRSRKTSSGQGAQELMSVFETNLLLL
ncbi:hypothetical protein N0V92_011935 [Colletotrichum tropicale]|nr:hypothetical protein N0V92_011935 [Colletotrichum tropicale]